MSKELHKVLASSMPTNEKIINYMVGNRKYFLEIWRDVSKPNYYTDFMAENITNCRGKECMEIGCGCGIICILMAEKRAKKVLGIDINPLAVELSKNNARINGCLNKIDFLACDFTKNMPDKKFELIVTIPPNIPTPKNHPIDKHTPFAMTNEGGIDGREVVDKIILKASNFLKPKGVLQLLTADFIGTKKTTALLRKSGFAKVLHKKKKARPGPFTTSRMPYIEKATGYKFKKDEKGFFFNLVLFTAKKSK